MPRAVLPTSLRPSDVMRVYPKVGKPGFGSRVVVVEKETHSDTVKLFYRGLTGGTSDRRVSDSREGIVFLSRKILHPVEGVWEGEITPGSRGRIVLYNNRRYETPALQKGEDTKVATKTKRGAASKGRAASKAKSNGGGERATEAQLDKLAARVVTMRDGQGKAWGDICDALDIQPSRARQLYNRGGGEPNTPDRKPAGKKGGKGRASTAASRRKGKNPS